MKGLGAAYGLLVAMLGGAGLGYVIDMYFRVSPWGLLLGSLLGFAVGLYGVYQALMKQ